MLAPSILSPITKYLWWINTPSCEDQCRFRAVYTVFIFYAVLIEMHTDQIAGICHGADSALVGDNTAV